MKSHKIILAVVAALLLLSLVTFSDARASISPPGEMSGGDYVLSPRSAAQAQAGGYQLLDSPAEKIGGSGCCCKVFLACITK